MKLLCSFLFLTTVCFAQQSLVSSKEKFKSPPNLQGRSNFKNFSTEDGLPLDAFECSYIDRKGNLWLGTTGGGVSCYDGKNFFEISTLNGLSNDVVTSIFEDRNGIFWFGTYNGISRFDGKSITNFFEFEGRDFKTIRSISEDKNGHLWFGTVKGVAQYDGQRFTNPGSENPLINTAINATVVDKKGNIWIGSDRGLSRYDGNSFTNYTKAQGLEADKIMTLFEDRTGNLWIGGYQGGVTRFDGLSFETFTQKDGLAHNDVWSIAQDDKGVLWFATSGGLSSYDGSLFTNYTTENGLPTNELASLSVDHDGNLWIASYNGGGVSLFSSRETMNFTRLDHPSLSKIRAVVENKKTRDLWIGTEDGLVSYNGQSFKTFNRSDGLPSDVILTLYKSRDDILWIGTLDGGLCKFDGESFTTITNRDGLIANDIVAIYEDKKGGMWISYTEPGLSRYDGKYIQNFSSESGLPMKEVSCITEDARGNLWVGTNGGGVSYLNGEKFITYTDAHGLPSNKVLGIVSDEHGNLWVGTHRGLSRFDGKNFLHFSLGKEWGTNVIHELLFTANGELVMGTNAGLFVLFKFVSNADSVPVISAANILSNKELSAYTPVFEEFNSSTGYQIGAISGVGANALMVDQDGVVWVATRAVKSGLVRFDLNAVRRSVRKPEVAIQKVIPGEDFFSWYSLQSGISTDSLTRAFQEIFSHGRVLPEKERTILQKRMSGVSFTNITPFNPLPVDLTLPYAHNQLNFEFKIVGIAANSEISYQYILEGEDNEWSTWTYNTTATYKNLHEGKYTFKVRARNMQTNMVSPGDKSFSFLILPPWYRTWWAYAGYLLAFVSSFVFGIQWNSRRLMAINLKLEAAVQNRTEEIATQNEELIAQHEEILAQRDIIENHNRKLELTVKDKTIELGRSYDELKKQFQRLEQFSFIVAHNLRSPVARIMGLANIFNQKDLSDKTNLTILTKTVEAARGLDEIIRDLNQILYVQNNTHAEKVNIQILGFIDGIKNRFKHEIEESGIIVNVQTEVASFTTILPYFDSILTNLFSNAIKYKAQTQPSIVTLLFTEGENVYRLIFEDNGLGFDSEKYADKLFQPFQRFNTHIEGKGLGLYLIKSQVDALGASISLTSKSGVGTKVEIVFPKE